MKRFTQSCKAYNSLPKFDKKETANQQELTKEIVNLIRARRDKFYSSKKSLCDPPYFNRFHIHKCAYKIYSNDKAWCAKMCREEQKKLPAPPFEDYCDICPKMTTISFDNEFNIMFAERSFTEEEEK